MGQGFCDLLEMSAMGTDGIGKSSVLSILWEIVCGERRGVVLYQSVGGACHTVLEARKVGAETS